MKRNSVYSGNQTKPVSFSYKHNQTKVMIVFFLFSVYGKVSLI